jgi:hypothetical protein
MATVPAGVLYSRHRVLPSRLAAPPRVTALRHPGANVLLHRGNRYSLRTSRFSATELVPAFRHWVGGTGAEVYLLAVRPQPTRIERRGDRIVHLDEQQAEEQATWGCYLTGPPASTS